MASSSFLCRSCLEVASRQNSVVVDLSHWSHTRFADHDCSKEERSFMWYTRQERKALQQDVVASLASALKKRDAQRKQSKRRASAPRTSRRLKAETKLTSTPPNKVPYNHDQDQDKEKAVMMMLDDEERGLEPLFNLSERKQRRKLLLRAVMEEQSQHSNAREQLEQEASEPDEPLAAQRHQRVYHRRLKRASQRISHADQRDARHRGQLDAFVARAVVWQDIEIALEAVETIAVKGDDEDDDGEEFEW